MLSGVQTGYGTPHDKYDKRGIPHAWTNRKDDIFMQRRLVQNFTFILEWGQGTCSLTKHTRRWAYSRYFFPACCLLRFAAFLSYGPDFRHVIITFKDFSNKGLYGAPCPWQGWHHNNQSPTTTHPPPTQTQYYQCLSCYSHDFDQTLKVSFWYHL